MPSTATFAGKAVPYNLIVEKGATFDFPFTRRQKPTVKRRISAITRANPGVVTAPAHGFLTGETRYLSKLKGMDQANNRAYTITVLDGNRFSLGVDTTAYDPYVSGGIADNGKPRDLTGCTARMHVREKTTDAAAVLSMTTENGGIVLGGTAGTIRIVISAAATAALTIATGFYDLELIEASGFVRRLLSGTVTVSNENTR